ncbi:DUF295 domain-containing protein [Heracleum sosnowskyi]|uniref:DUF295 domain-containing protein n=1 Tax=Heracleum sosnowskyi TaxID=360622 RepID=A0AAD8M0D7_9APIA|nr:DUF295 domain-containing protein [Heracleum sosnowskyi]
MVNSVASTFSSSPQLGQGPLLVLPIHDDYNKQCDLYTHAGSKISPKIIDTNMCGNNSESSRCVGSSKGWMILHHSNDQNCDSSLSLFSPSCGVTKKIVLPSFNRPSGFANSWITKSIVTSSPVISGHEFGVAFMYGMCDYQVALLSMHGTRDDENKWIELKSNSRGENYCDVISHQECLFGLLTSGFVVVWDLRSTQDGSSVCKKMEIKTSYIEPVVEFGDKLRDLYTGRFYLVESQGNMLLVFRVVGEFVRGDGEVVNEGALLDDEEYSHLVLPYKTKNFYVYKLDYGLKKWEKIDSLEDQILFVGLNESMSFSTLSNQGNSIYFTDDNWDHINIPEHESYGGHDMGIFNLSDKNVKEIFEVRRMVPPPVWIDLDIAAL